MLLQLFKAILLTSIVGSILTVILLLLKPATKWCFGSGWQYYIWLTVLVVMMLPVTIKLHQTAPVPPVSQIVKQPTTETVIQTETETQAISMQAMNTTPFYNTVNKVKDIYLGIADIICYIWLIGCLLILGLNIIKYSVFLWAIHKKSVIITCPEIGTEKIITRKTSMIDAPLMIGLFRPTLLLPDLEMTQENLNYILLHELTHYRRHDLLYKWFAMFVNTVHWFNPFVYIVSKQIDEECETSCDLSVVADMNEQEQNAYMNTILTLVSQTGTKRKALTTAMASTKKQIQRRFMMIRTMRKTKKNMAVVSVIMACMILATTIFASGVLANALEGTKNVIINGKGYDIKPVYVENTRYLHTDSYYLPLRATFEALECKVNYNISRETLSGIWNIGESTLIFPNYDWRENLVTDDITSQIYGTTTRPNKNMPIIEIVPPTGDKWYCQIGCEMITDNINNTLFNWSSPPITIDGKAYISLRSLVQFLIPNGEDSSDSIFWDSQKHDTYYVGRLVFDEERQIVTIDTSNKPNNIYSQAIASLYEMGDIMQTKENNKYIFAIIGNDRDEPSEIKCAVVEKLTGKIAVIEDAEKVFVWYMLINFETDDEITLTKTNDSAFFRKYNLSECEYN